jgi:hypothetical protein
MIGRFARTAIIASLFFSLQVLATDIRGRVDTQNPYNGYYHPMARAEVALISPAHNQTVSVTMTGSDGFYYFYGIMPGSYYLVINRSLRIQVTIPPSPGYDIRPVLFR